MRALAKFLPLSTEFRDGLEADSGRADYASFALNPTSGLDVTPDGDDPVGAQIDHDPETGEVAQVEDQRHAQQTIEPEREKVSAPATRRRQTPRTDSTPYTEGGPQSGQQGALDMAAEGKSEAPEHFDDFVSSVDGAISDEMNDGMSLAEVLDLHGAQLAEIKKHAPKRDAEMM